MRDKSEGAQFKPSDIFANGNDGEIGTVEDGGLRRQIYRDGKLVEDFIVPMPTKQENGRFFIDYCGREDIDGLYVCPAYKGEEICK